MGLIKSILDKFKAEKDIQPNPAHDDIVESGDISNQKILKELEQHFTSVMKSESLGQRMLYPMAFTVLLHPDDYATRVPYLPHVVPEIVKAFYRIIEANKMIYPNFEPPAKYWFFQFSPCENGLLQFDGEENVELEKGKIMTIGTLTTFDINDTRSTAVDTNTRVSVKLENSNVNNNMNINRDAIRNLTTFGESTFTINFDSSLSQNQDRIMQNSNLAEVNGLAELSYSRGGRNYRFTMRDNLIHISGKNDMRKGREFFVIEEEENIRNSHVQIRYLPDVKRFQIAAFGPTRLNSGKMEESSGGNVVWYDLANNSSIFINGLISVRFVKK